MCCVFESYVKNEIPAAVFSPESFTPTLYETRQILTDSEKSLRVSRSIPKKISGDAASLVSLMFLSRGTEWELTTLRFLRLGFKHGAAVCSMLQNDVVSAVMKTTKSVTNEAHLSKEFLRFSDTGAGLVARIKPKNLVLPLMQAHFCDRFPEETFLILDMTHSMALAYSPYKARIIPAEWIETPPDSEDEAFYKQLWKRFYIVAGVEGRFNPKCRQTHMPKRYWDCMTEFDQLLLTEHGMGRESLAMPGEGPALPKAALSENEKVKGPRELLSHPYYNS